MRASSSPREASSTNVTARPRARRPRIAASSQTSVATPKSDDLLRVEQVEQRVGVRVREDVEVLLQQQELASLEPALGHGGQRERHRIVLRVSAIFSAPRVPRRQCGG